MAGQNDAVATLATTGWAEPARSATPLIELRGVSKSYGVMRALQDLDLQINPREVVAILGDNGAGKSTLIKIMSGIVQADGGTMLADGMPVQLRSRRDSEQLGIETIYQDSALVNTMSVARNIFMGRELTNRLDFMRHRAMRTTALEILQGVVQIGGIGSPDVLVGELSGGQRQSVAIARAVYFKRRILLLDEPTSALAVRATEALFAYIKALRGEGVSSVLVTHNIYHAYQLCDRFVVMSHGRKIYDVPKHETSIEELTKNVMQERHD